MKKYDFIPDGYSAVTPLLIVKNAAAAMEWYKKIFGAVETGRLTEPDGVIVHAEMRIMDAVIMLAEENPANHNNSPQTLKGTPVILNLYVQDADEVVSQSVKSGATIIFPIDDQFYGDRAGRISDPFGYMWIVSTRKNNLSDKEIQDRKNEMAGAE